MALSGFHGEETSLWMYYNYIYFSSINVMTIIIYIRCDQQKILHQKKLKEKKTYTVYIYMNKLHKYMHIFI